MHGLSWCSALAMAAVVFALAAAALRAEDFRDFLKRDGEAMREFQRQSAGKASAPGAPTNAVSAPKPAPRAAPPSPGLRPAAERARPPNALLPRDEEPEMTALAPDAICKVASGALTEMRQWLAPFAAALHYAALKYPGDAETLRVVFAAPDGEFLELEMAYKAADGALTVGEASVVTHGRDAEWVKQIIREYEALGVAP